VFVGELILLAVIAIAVRLIGLDHPAWVDEMNHVLAAQSLVHDGTLRINGGEPYTRAWMFTYIVAWSFRLFGETMVAGRIPAVVAGVALALALFAWVRSVAGRTAAWTAGLLFAIAPFQIWISQSVRFYTIQCLAFFVGAVCCYEAVVRGRSRRNVVLLGAGAVVSFLVAYRLQLISIIGIFGVLVWLVGTVGAKWGHWLARRASEDRRAAAISAAAALIVVLIAVLVVRSGLPGAAWELYRHADLWAMDQRDNFTYYFWQLQGTYPTIWTIFPVVLLLALVKARRAAALCAVVFGIAFVVLSFGGMKGGRYLSFAMPMFFALTGFAVAALIPWLRSRLEWLANEVFPRAAVSPGHVRLASNAFLVGAALFAAVGNNGVANTISRVAHAGGPRPAADPRYPDWSAAAPTLKKLADSAAVVISSAELKPLFFIGRQDVELSATQLYDVGKDAPQFSIQPKYDLPVISTPAALQLLMQCEPSGLVIVEGAQWRVEWQVPPDASDFIATHMEQVPVDERWGFRVFRWRTPDPVEGAGCPDAGARASRAHGAQHDAS
jgi:4-amino-4-deoxy-L-arabinose transferase-like glycosyltransferase